MSDFDYYCLLSKLRIKSKSEQKQPVNSQHKYLRERDHFNYIFVDKCYGFHSANLETIVLVCCLCTVQYSRMCTDGGNLTVKQWWVLHVENC